MGARTPACFGDGTADTDAPVSAAADAWVREWGLPRVCRGVLVDQLGESLLLATDLSDASRDARDRAMQLAEEGDIPLLILAIVPAESGSDGVFRVHLAEHLAAVIRAASQRGIDAEGLLLVGDPAETILRIAASKRAGAIVMAHDQWRGSSAGGCICGHVVLHTPCPVLLTGTHPA